MHMGEIVKNELKSREMKLKKPRILYHYCSVETFLSIIKSSSIWLSDVKKSNDFQEMKWLRQHYYYYILKKYKGTKDKNIKQICEIILSVSRQDGFQECPTWLLPASGETSKQINDIFNSLRVYTFCLSQDGDSLGQWRGYADNGAGVAIGFSREYFDAISGHGLLCPIFNFMLGDVSYKTDFTSLFDSLFSMHDVTTIAEFVYKNLQDITHVSALFKHPSFKEEKEWRIIYSMSDYGMTNDLLHFSKFDLVSSDDYKKNFAIPRIDYSVIGSNIVPHIELKINDMPNAIQSIVLGPKCKAQENDINHVLLNFGLKKNIKDPKIKVVRSKSTYR